MRCFNRFRPTGCEDLVEMIRHVMFHGYHALLRGLGQHLLNEEGLQGCRISNDDPYHIFTFIVAPFICRWNSCGAQFLCPAEVNFWVIFFLRFLSQECIKNLFLLNFENFLESGNERPKEVVVLLPYEFHW